MHFDWREFLCSVWDVISSNGMPAWVQAIGSLVALVVAFRVSRLSVEHAGLLKQKTTFSIAEAAREYANKIRAAIEDIDDDPGSNVSLYGVYHRDVTSGLVRALQGVPMHELASGKQVEAILGLANQLVFMGNATDKLLGPPLMQPEVLKALESVGDDHEQRRRISHIALNVLKANALNHLDKIDEYYFSLKSTFDN
ncbi:hypothetical protein DV532_18710 [Pseudomonas sp. Leaf58]|uniref:hypothetical protein n=1 Tax=Pseudomonas sp. Leaf58 TaxID=1736226 RepID=UPI0006FCE947|nr:hypothetical protein [Pseudomonas sp. Leaf58]AYG46207.1 hypothetical protein DV532_18710 [Pseudomonas sp. Leaf58]KQN59505.1 hypothetical protein ASF02_21900 [Pseudomonas sp. Leaf58]